MFSLKVSTFHLVRRVPLSPFPQITSYTYCRKIDTEQDTRTCKYRRYEELYTRTGYGCKFELRRFYASSSADDETATGKKVDFSNLKGKLKEVMRGIELKEMANAPPPVFWYIFAGLIPMVGTPLSFILFGYSPALAALQLTFAATTCSFVGGVKFGYSLPPNNKHEPSWENITWSVAPQSIAWLGLLLPPQMGLLAVAAGLSLSAFVDLTSVNYPVWFKGIRYSGTIVCVSALLLTFILKLIMWK